MSPSSGQNIKLHGTKGSADRKEGRNQGCEGAKGHWMAIKRDKTHSELWDTMYCEVSRTLKFLRLFFGTN